MKASDVISGSERFAIECCDVLAGLRSLPDECVHTCVTSPPYYGLRSYLPAGHVLKPLEMGSEESPGKYIARMVEVFSEVRRVLRDDGVMWLNIGDSYSSGGGVSAGNSNKGNNGSVTRTKRIKRGQQRLAEWSVKNAAGGGHAASNGLNGEEQFRDDDREQGNLLGVPWRLALALVDDGWILRSACVWNKASAMPESVSGWRWQRCRVKVAPSKKPGYHPVNGDHDIFERNHTSSKDDKTLNAQWSDCAGCKKCKLTDGLILRRGSWRPTRSHEFVFMFVKSSCYFGDGESVRTKLAEATVQRDTYSRITGTFADEQYAVAHDHETVSTAGANLRDVWTLSTEGGGFKGKHYATFPLSLPTICIQASVSQHGHCAECGAAWARIVETTAYEPEVVAVGVRNVDDSRGDKTRKIDGKSFAEQASSRTLGWRPSCQCDAGTTPGIVLDPFAGVATTGIAALRLGQRFVGFELNPEYADMGRARIKEDAGLFA